MRNFTYFFKEIINKWQLSLHHDHSFHSLLLICTSTRSLLVFFHSSLSIISLSGHCVLTIKTIFRKHLLTCNVSSVLCVVYGKCPGLRCMKYCLQFTLNWVSLPCNCPSNYPGLPQSVHSPENLIQFFPVLPLGRGHQWYLPYTSNACKEYCCRVFSVAGPVCWNGLPDYLKSPDLSFDCFKSQLKTFLFCV